MRLIQIESEGDQQGNQGGGRRLCGEDPRSPVNFRWRNHNASLHATASSIILGRGSKFGLRICGCVSAWKKDPIWGVIGVQKGPRLNADAICPGRERRIGRKLLSWVVELRLLRAELAIESIKTEADKLWIDARPLGMTAACPVCGTLSTRIHSRYRRTLTDLPSQGRRVVVSVCAHRFRCVLTGSGANCWPPYPFSSLMS